MSKKRLEACVTSDTAETDEGGNRTRVAGETPDDTTEDILDRWEAYHYNGLRKWWVILHGAGALAFAMFVLMRVLGRPSPGGPYAGAMVVFLVLLLGGRLIIFVVGRRARRDAGSGEYPPDVGGIVSEEM